MLFDLALKSVLSLAVGFVFWFFAFLVFMVYSFMPVTKLGHSIIFAVAAPVLYMVAANIALKKLFKETGWQNIFINLMVTGVMTALSLFAIDFLAKVVR